MVRARRVLPVSLALVALASDVGLAQTTVSAGANVAVGVVQGLTILIDQDLSFGWAVTGSGPKTVAVTDANAARIRIYGQQNQRVFISLVPQANLTSGASTVPYAWAAAYNETANDPSTATAFGTTDADFRLRDTSPPGADGQAFMWIHGSVNVGPVPAGVYTGTVTISVTY